MVDAALEVGLTTLAITDHDIVGGVAPGRRAAAGRGLEIIAGIEFSSNLGGHEFHILGLFIDIGCERLLEAARRSRAFRRQRAEEIVGRLAALGLPIDFATVEAAAANGSIGRPHIAHALVHHGAVATVDDAFRNYIGIGRPAFTPKPTLDAAEVIDVVHQAGGVAILAHPASSRASEAQIRDMAALGLDGFEVRHPKHGRQAEAKLSRLIDDTGLLPSSGSDFHGPGSGRTSLGDKAVPQDWFDALRDNAAQHQRASATTKDER